MERDSFVFYRSFYDAIQDLDAEQTRELVVAMCERALNWNDIETKWVVKIAYNLIKPQLDANTKRYVDWCKGWQYWAMWWRPPKDWDNSQKPHRGKKDNPIGVKEKTPNDNVNDNVNENENDNEKGSREKQDTQLTFDANASHWNIEERDVGIKYNSMKLNDKLHTLWLEDEVIDTAMLYNSCKKWKKLDKFKEPQLRIRVNKLRKCWFNTTEWMIQVLENSIAWWYEWIFELKQKPNTKPKPIEEGKVVNVWWANIFF